MKQKQLTVNFEFNDHSEHSLDFVFPDSDEKQFNEWLLNSLADPQKNWLLIPEDSKRKCKTLLNTRNITRIDIHDTSHLLKQKESEENEVSNL